MRWVVFIALLGLDLGSKFLASSSLPAFCGAHYPFGGIPLFSNLLGISFSLNLVGNTGAAWGAFSGNPGILFGLRLLIVGALGISLFFYDRPMLKKLSILLIGAGAIGNAVDYLLYGHVVDFFHFVFWGYSFPVFNLADAYITCGAALLLLSKRFKTQRSS